MKRYLGLVWEPIFLVKKSTTHTKKSKIHFDLMKENIDQLLGLKIVVRGQPQYIIFFSYFPLLHYLRNWPY